MKFQVYKDAKGEYRWRLVASNGRIVADCAEGYKAKKDCLHGIDLVKTDGPKATVEDKDA